MGINYKYDIDTEGGGWYLYELDFPPSYLAPLKKNADGREGKRAWGIYGEDGRMSNFRFGVWRWNPMSVGFADGYVIDETHDKYWGGHVGEPKYITDPRDHRWPCFCMDAQVIAGLSMLEEHFWRASVGAGRGEGTNISLGNSDALADHGFRFYLPDLPEAIEYMLKNDIPRDHYKEVASRVRTAREVKKEKHIEWGNLGWGYGAENGRPPVLYEGRQKWDSPVGEVLDRYAAAIDKMLADGDCELTLKHLQGTMDGV